MYQSKSLICVRSWQVVTDHAPEAKTSSEDLSRSITGSISLINAVIDRGVGLTEEEQEKLFRKLSQQSFNTHIEYGGSPSRCRSEKHYARLIMVD